MRPTVISALFAVLALALVLPAPASALDCTPFQSWTCSQQGYFGYLNGIPGEVICGVDYTGWTLHVVAVTVAQAGWFQFSATTGVGFGTTVATAVLLMDDCAAGTCVSSAQSTSVTDLGACLDVGTYTFVVASQTTAPTAVVNMGLACLTCAQAESYGLVCPYCGTVGNDSTVWGSLKLQYR
jgi:hypothetical protein